MNDQTNKKEGLKIVRDFKAPKALVFQAFATAEAFADWWGPAGMPVTVTHFDFRQGGKTHYKIDAGGHSMWGLFKYGNIVKPDLVEFVSSFSDEAGNVCKAPFPMDFPMEISNQLTLVENNGVTTLTLQGHPINATPEQEATYAAMSQSMEGGFAGTFNQLEAYLAKIGK